MQVVAVANQKGGVGKTTVTVCLAGALAHRGLRVLVIDLDPQAGATKVLGIDASEQPSMADLMLAGEDHSVREAVTTTTWGLDLAPSEIALARKEMQREAGDDLLLRAAIEAEALDYDAVLVDCPPQLGVITVNALAAADRLLLVTEPSYVAQTGVADLLETLGVVQRRLNLGLELGGVVVDMADRTREARLRMQETLDYFGSEAVWEPAIPRRAAIRETLGRGLPLHSPQARRDARKLAGLFDQLSERVA